MVSITLAVMQQGTHEKLLLLKKMDTLLSKSKLTEKDALDLGKKVNHAITKNNS